MELAFTEGVCKIYEIQASVLIYSLTSTAGKMHRITGCLQPINYGNEPSKIVISNISHELFLITILVIAATVVPQLGKCLRFMAFQGVILYRIQSFLSPRTDLNFRHPVVTL